MPSDLQNDAPARAGASFSLSPLSRKCAPKVVPLVPFWEVFGHQNRIESVDPLVERLLEPAEGDRVYPIPLPPFPAEALPSQMLKNT